MVCPVKDWLETACYQRLLCLLKRADEFGCLPGFNRDGIYEVSINVSHHKDVRVPVIKDCWELSCLVRPDNLFKFL